MGRTEAGRLVRRLLVAAVALAIPVLLVQLLIATRPLGPAVLHHSVAGVFVLAALWRAALMGLARRASPVAALPDGLLPPYSVLVPIYREAGMVPQLVAALDALDYPLDRRQIMLLLEEDDAETQEAVRAHGLPASFGMLVGPPGYPQTKPRACNVALDHARGELLTIYDAEDRPDPQQLREAAARFAAGPANLGCLQAPLRISNSGGFLPAQFANEYAAQFELLLPAMARLQLPFPLGGTSNHLRMAALRQLGGWDAYNVTEDADLGFRLARAGWRLDVMNAPTWENAPEEMYSWLPQRTRWLKGYIQTLLAQARRAGLRWRIWLGMGATLGLAIGSASVHLPAFAWLTVYGIFWCLGGPGPSLTPLDLTALVGGWTAAVATGALGAAKAGLPVRVQDALMAPIYWPLLTIAMVHAVFRAVLEPHHWDKTDHTPWPGGAGA